MSLGFTSKGRGLDTKSQGTETFPNLMKDDSVQKLIDLYGLLVLKIHGDKNGPHIERAVQDIVEITSETPYHSGLEWYREWKTIEDLKGMLSCFEPEDDFCSQRRSLLSEYPLAKIPVDFPSRHSGWLFKEECLAEYEKSCLILPSNWSPVHKAAKRKLLARLTQDFPKVESSDDLYEKQYKGIIKPEEYTKLKRNVSSVWIEECLSKDFLGADALYEKYCKDFINREEYNKLKRRPALVLLEKSLSIDFLGTDSKYEKHYKDIVHLDDYCLLKQGPTKDYLRKLLSDDFLGPDKVYQRDFRNILPIEEYFELKRKPALVYLQKVLEGKGLAEADRKYAEHCKDFLTTREYSEIKVPFVKNWLRENLPVSHDVPDDQQVRSICETLQNTLLIARAGSGKTATLINRAYFLIKHLDVDPTEIILLAFNRNAADEMQERLLFLLNPMAKEKVHEVYSQRKGDRTTRKDAIRTVVSEVDNLPHVMTFHKLAWSIVHPKEDILFDEGDSEGLSRSISKLVHDRLQVEFERNRIRNFMLEHSKQDWERLVRDKYDKGREEFLTNVRSLPNESLGGDYVKSQGEKLIANFLFEHNLNYKYELNHGWLNKRTYRPDFSVFRKGDRWSGLIVEYYGMAGTPDYDELSTEKSEFWDKKRDWNLLEIYPHEIANGSFAEKLKESLNDNGIALNRLDEEQIWELVRDRFVTRFAKILTSFIGRCRQRNLSPNQIKVQINAHQPLDELEKRFLEMASEFYHDYLRMLTSEKKEDFNGLMQRAIGAINEGITSFGSRNSEGDLSKIRFLCVDEYQDFSILFHDLVKAFQSRNQSANLFCVGDDWQAINSFAGSDLRFFNDFEKHFENVEKLYLTNNYRSCSRIVQAGNKLMEGRGIKGIPTKKELGEVISVDLDDFKTTLSENERHPGDLMTPAILRIVKKCLDNDSDVVLLARRNSLPRSIKFPELPKGTRPQLSHFLDLVRSYLPEGLRHKITISTAHGFKGRQKESVVILDALSTAYPLIHPDWVFSRIHGDELEKIVDEERRLFYVALTRAQSSLFIMTYGGESSAFYEDILSVAGSIDWDEYRPFKVGEINCVFVQIKNAYEIRERLKKKGYRWKESSVKAWVKSINQEAFDMEKIKTEDIGVDNLAGLNIEVSDEEGNVLQEWPEVRVLL